jgi:hypothetical protein
MVLAEPAAPRWPGVAADRGHYESYYLRAVDPTGGRGVWIRYTVSVAPGGPPTGQLWFTFFDRSAPAPRAVRVDAGQATTGHDAWIRMGDRTFGPSGIEGRGESVSWTLRYRDAEPTLEHLPRDWMYRARLPRTKLLSLSPSARFHGTVEVDGESISVDGWRGMVGHNWGEQHAEQWIWLHGLGFEGAATDTWLDVALGRVRIGPVVTPWIANGAVSLGGERIPLGGLGRRVSVDAAADRCDLRIPGAGVTVRATVSAPSDAFVTWDYADPDPGRPEHRVLNCSIADLTVTVARRGVAPVKLRTSGHAAYELGRAAGRDGHVSR